MNSPTHNSNPTSGPAGGSKAGSGASHLLAPASPHGARFFIRDDGQYLVVVHFEYTERWTHGGKFLMNTTVMKIRTAALGFTPDHEGKILPMEDFFLN